MLKRVLLASTALVAMASPAMADPVSLVIAGVNAIMGAGTLASGTALLTVAGTTVLTVGNAIGIGLAVGVAALGSALSGNNRANLDPGATKQTLQTAEMGVQHCIGTVRVGGLQIYGNTKAYDTYRLIGHCEEPIDGIEEYYLGGRFVVVEPTGEVSTPPYAKSGGSWAIIKTETANPNKTAWADLVSTFPAIWTSNHRARGITQSLVKHISPGVSAGNYLKLRSGGIPELEIRARFGSFYDPRDGQYRWTENGIILAMYVYLSFPGASLDDFDLAFQAIESDKADAIVATRTGTEPRSRIAGRWTETDGPRGDIMEQVLRSAGAEQINLAGGKIGFRLIEENRGPTLHIPADHIIDITIKSGPDGVERPNKCKLSFYSRENLFTSTELDLVDDRTSSTPIALAWSQAANEIGRVGEKLHEEKLDLCFSSAQAQRITRRRFTMARGDRVTVITDYSGISAWRHKTVSFDVDWLDAPLVVEIDPPDVDDAEGRVTISGIAQPYLEPWNPASHEAMPPDTTPEPEYQTDVVAPLAATSAIVVVYPDGAHEIRVSYPSTGITGVFEAVWREDVLDAWSSMTDETSPVLYCRAAVASTPTQVITRARQFSGDSGSLWSAIFTGTPLADNSAPASPTITGETEVTAPTSINVAYVSVKIGSAAAVNYAARPYQAITVSSLPSGAIVKAHASDGTASAGVTVP